MPPPESAHNRPRTMTASEAAALVGVSVATIRGWADSGVIPAHRTIGGHRRFEVSELTAWLTARGAPAAERLRPRRNTSPILTPCPLLARALNARTESILDAVEAGYDPSVPLVVDRSTTAALRRSVLRYLRIATHALDSGSLSSARDRSRLVGVRAGLQGPEGRGVILEFGRFAATVTAEAEAELTHMAEPEPAALPRLRAVLDAMHAAVIDGFVEGRMPPGDLPPEPGAQG